VKFFEFPFPPPPTPVSPGVGFDKAYGITNKSLSFGRAHETVYDWSAALFATSHPPSRELKTQATWICRFFLIEKQLNF